MAITKDICILNLEDYAPGIISIRFCIWLSAANPYPNPNFVSAYINIDNDAITGPGGQNVKAALQAGTLVEEVYTFTVPANVVQNRWASLETILLDTLNARKAYKAGTLNIALPDRGAKLGITHDSATGTWSA